MKIKLKVIIFTLIISGFVFFPNSRASAAVSWPDLLNAAFDTMLETLSKEIYGAILGAAKQAAVETITTTVDNMIAGGSATGAMFITDWENYLFAGPSSKTNLYMNDFFSVSTRGRHANSNYLSNCLGLNGGNYSKYLVDNAKKFTVEIDLTGIQTDLEEFACGGAQGTAGLFSDGWRSFSALSSKPANNPFGYVLLAQKEQMIQQQKNEKEALAKAQAYGGYKGNEQNGVVISPGSLIKDIHSNSTDLPNKILAGANNTAEVIGAVVARIATSAIKSGIGSAQSYAQSNINQNINSMYGGINDSLGPDGGYYRPAY